MGKKNSMAVNEGKELKYLRSLPNDCKKCGESSEYARTYGCPNARPDCPHDKKLRKELKKKYKR
jgi:hypothetical protein